MAFTWRSKRWGYDNIATGSATGIERIVDGTARTGGVGATPGVDSTTRQCFDNVMGTSTDGLNTSIIANRMLELVAGAQSTDSNTNNEPTSATTPGYTSGTSFTSAVGELLG